MRYISTRDGSAPPRYFSFVDAVLEGLAPDGGLLVPERVPEISASEWRSWQSLPRYQDLCVAVLRKFISIDEVTDAELVSMVEAAYSTFRDPSIVPIHTVNTAHPIHVMELFHGPTFAFKDVALQLLGHLFDFALRKRNARMTILGATSGDTGSAAIAGVKGRANIDCVILFPLGRTSKIQELQMTSNVEKNIHCLAVEEAVFDDCQSIVKTCFGDESLRKEFSLGAVNSINWARILAQIVYYVAGAKSYPDKQVTFVVPTGNFGNVLAGYYAKRMGVANLGKLVIASNSNDILPNFFETGKYVVAGSVIPTLSPSMDIAVSSNFERFLFDLWGRDGQIVVERFEKLKSGSKQFEISPEELEKAREIFTCFRVNESETVDTIARIHKQHGYLLCPHSAVGFAAAERYHPHSDSEVVISLATAHIGKFTEQLLLTVKDKQDLTLALEASVPVDLRKLDNAPTGRIDIHNSPEAVKEYLRKHVSSH